jgi:hypothetical protein
VGEFRYLGTTLTNQNSIQEEIKNILKVGNACYHLVQNLFSSSFLSEDIKIEIYRTIILRVVLYECDTWLLTLREEHRLRMFENRVLRRIFGPRRGELIRQWRELNELNYQYSSQNIIRAMKSRMRCSGHVAYRVERNCVYRVLVRNREGKA